MLKLFLWLHNSACDREFSIFATGDFLPFAFVFLSSAPHRFKTALGSGFEAGSQYEERLKIQDWAILGVCFKP